MSNIGELLSRLATTVRRGLVLLVIVALITLNVATATSGYVANLLSGVAVSLLGHSVLASVRKERDIAKRELARAGADLKQTQQHLDQTKYELENRTKDLQDEKHIRTKVEKQLELEGNRRKIVQPKVRTNARRISERTFRAAGRNALALPLESVPAVGFLTTLAVTALDIDDACQTAKDMDQILLDHGLEQDTEPFTAKICAYRDQLPNVADFRKNITPQECLEYVARNRQKLGDDIADTIRCPDIKPPPPLTRPEEPPPKPPLPKP